jgi:hypothetical protein
MKTENQINTDILNTIMEIKSRYPELSKYLEEMPVRYRESDDINPENLKDYYNSLKTLLRKYDNEHNASDFTKKSITETETKDVFQEQEHKSTFFHDPSEEKLPGEKRKRNRVNNYSQSRKDDLPDSEPDNPQESVGNEDEKNSDCSPGGDNHDHPKQER